MSATTTATTNTTTTKKKPYKLDTLIAKYRTTGLETVADYLTTKARKSKQTAFLYSSGLRYLDKFIQQNYDGKYNVQTILDRLTTTSKELDVYKLLNSFVSYLQNDTANGQELSPRSIAAYMVAARSYFQYNDIDVLPIKFKNKITMPRIYGEDEQAIDGNDIKQILHHCENRRLKAYLLVLASSGCRAMEALTLRECDISFDGIDFANPNDTSEPAVIHVRKEYSKTKRERNIFISNEAARYLKQWIDYIYRDRTLERKDYVSRVRRKDDLIFSRIPYNGTYPTGLYSRILVEFQKVLERSGLSSRKSDGVYNRRKITFHSFRRFVKTTIANQTKNDAYGEWFLGHSKSPYYTNKPDQLKQIYKEDCMKYLTFLDYPTLDATAKTLEGKLKDREEQIEQLKQRIANLEVENSKELERLKIEKSEIDELKAQAEQYKSFMSTFKPQLDEFQRELNSLRKLEEEKKKRKQEETAAAAAADNKENNKDQLIKAAGKAAYHATRTKSVLTKEGKNKGK
jgi:integrase